MITFNAILEKNGLSSKDVQLVRHQDRRNTAKITIHKLWQTSLERFEQYQRVQNRKKFTKKYIACFVVTPEGKTLFVAIYKVNSLGVAPKGSSCPVHNTDDAGKYLYELKRQEKLFNFSERLIIEWGKGRAFVQYASGNDKEVIELRRHSRVDPFPGFRDFTCDLSSLANLPENWKDHLRKTHGIYLLICKKTGKRYVGSSQGEHGLWQRLHNYEHGKDGGNIELMGLDMSHMQVTILERVDTGIIETIGSIENTWKKKLLTNKKKYPRALGLNAN